MDKKFMKRALELAKKAFDSGEVPVGAVIVKNGEIIGEGYNMREQKQNALSHAEIEAINSACKKLNSWRLDDCEMYVTLEPCPMCTGAIINSRIKTVIFGAFDSSMGCMDSVINLCDYPFNHKVEIYAGIMEDECKKILTDFFALIRN
jgi:tRNA(adenine34) deaminase